MSRKLLVAVSRRHGEDTKEEVLTEEQHSSSSLDQEDPPEPANIKEEQDELWTCQDGEQLQGLEEAQITKFTFSPVPVKIEEDDEENPESSQLLPTDNLKTEGDCCGGPEPDWNFYPGLKPFSCSVCGVTFRWRKFLLDHMRLHMEVKDTKEEFPPEQQDWSPSLDQEDPPEPTHIKVEQEELWTSQEGEQPHVLDEADIIKFTFSPVKSEEDNEESPESSQLHPTEDLKIEADVKESGAPEPDRDFDPEGHLQSESDDETPVSSEPETDDSCDWEESGMKRLRKNERNTGTAGKVFSCSLCEKTYTRYKSFMTHMRLHTEGKRFSCSVCQKTFQFNVEVVRHMRVHTGEKPFICSVCGKGFARKTEMEQHMRIHTGEKPFSCPHCNKLFAQRSNLTAHLRVHTGEKPFTCSVCQLSFSLRHNLSKHMRTHTGEKPFSCSLCGKEFRDSGTLKRHLNVHSGEKPFSCSICGKEFGARRTLKRHLNVHTGEKPFSCSVCGNRFGERRTLKRHMTIHSGEKPFSCSDCGKVFGERRTLKRHMIVHTGEKPFSCSVCDKSFTRLVNLKKHKCSGESGGAK